jgi:hypothetical protein
MKEKLKIKCKREEATKHMYKVKVDLVSQVRN